MSKTIPPPKFGGQGGCANTRHFPSWDIRGCLPPSNSVLFRYLSLNPATYKSFISLWIAPNLAVMAKVAVTKNIPTAVRWNETIPYETLDDLCNVVKGIVSRRWLQGVPVLLSLSNSDIFTESNFDQSSPIEEQDLLPAGVTWDSVEFAVSSSPHPLIAAMRQTDVDKWRLFCRNAGMTLAGIYPAGEGWNRIFDGTDEISCSFPGGTLKQQYANGHWNGGYFVPSLKDDSADESEISHLPVFSVPVKPAFSWAPVHTIPCLEPVLAWLESSPLNLNSETATAQGVFMLQDRMRLGSSAVSLFTVGLLCFALLMLAVTSLWNMGIKVYDTANGSVMARADSLLACNTEMENRLHEFEGVLKSKSHVSKTVYLLGKTASDSAWFSELRLSGANGNSITMIGHAVSERAVTALLNRIQSISGTAAVRLEYIEKVQPTESSNLTRGLWRSTLFRYKITGVM